MISIRNLFFRYDKDFEINIAELDIACGEKVALVGESGCGKTTLFSLIAGILHPHRGQITVNSHIITQLSDKNLREFRLQNIGFVFQNFELIDYLNVRENILLPFTLNSMRIPKSAQERLQHLLNVMGIQNKITQKPQQLSQGEKQRVAIARALIHNPALLIADEPTGNLDPQNSKKILDLLWQEIDENTTLLMITHDHSFLQKFDRVIHLNESLQNNLINGSEKGIT